MNKYLMMSAAAAFATTVVGDVQAKGTTSVHFGTASGGSYCDGVILTHKGRVYVGEFINTTCGASMPNIITEGLRDGPAKGGQVDLVDNSFAFNYHENYAASYDLFTPIKPGSVWQLWIAFSTASSFLANEGVMLPGQFTRQNPGTVMSTKSRILQSLKPGSVK